MNIALEQTEEYVNGQLKNKYGDAFIRGNNGRFEVFEICLIYLLQLPCPSPPPSFFHSIVHQHDKKKIELEITMNFALHI